MHEHVYRTVVAGEGRDAIAGTTRGILFHPHATSSDRYTGLILVTPTVRIAVLEGAGAPPALHRDALSLSGLGHAVTLLNQRTTFRWFSALLMQRFDHVLPDVSLATLTALCTVSPRELCSYVTTLALRARAHETQLAAQSRRAVESLRAAAAPVPVESAQAPLPVSAASPVPPVSLRAYAGR